MGAPTLRLGTRGSKLALAQADLVAALLRQSRPATEIEIVVIKTSGDRDQAAALSQMSTVGVFTKTIEAALREDMIDLAVHSAKDLPSAMTNGLTLAAVPTRAACEDVLVSDYGYTLANLPHKAIVGTGSPRRRAQLLYLRPGLQVKEIRGNIETRLSKLQSGAYDAILLARAGIERLGLTEQSSQALAPQSFLPAAGQGFLAVQTRTGDEQTLSAIVGLDDPEAHRCLDCERLLMNDLGAGCAAAVGAWARLEDNRLRMSAVVLDVDGRRRLETTGCIDAEEPTQQLADQVVSNLRAQGAMELIATNE
jgi:hydroxymethylbilane synthase